MAQALEQERLARDRIDQMVVQQTAHLERTRSDLEETRRKYRALQQRTRSRIRRLEEQRFRVFRVAVRHIRELEEQLRQHGPHGPAGGPATRAEDGSRIAG
jgi:hypothetical protein